MEKKVIDKGKKNEKDKNVMIEENYKIMVRNEMDEKMGVERKDSKEMREIGSLYQDGVRVKISKMVMEDK